MRALFFLLLFDQTIQQVTLSRSVTQSRTSIRILSDNIMHNFKLRDFKQCEYWPQFKLQVYPAILNKYVRFMVSYLHSLAGDGTYPLCTLSVISVHMLSLRSVGRMVPGLVNKPRLWKNMFLCSIPSSRKKQCPSVT